MEKVENETLSGLETQSVISASKSKTSVNRFIVVIFGILFVTIGVILFFLIRNTQSVQLNPNQPLTNLEESTKDYIEKIFDKIDFEAALGNDNSSNLIEQFKNAFAQAVTETLNLLPTVDNLNRDYFSVFVPLSFEMSVYQDATNGAIFNTPKVELDYKIDGSLSFQSDFSELSKIERENLIKFSKTLETTTDPKRFIELLRKEGYQVFFNKIKYHLNLQAKGSFNNNSELPSSLGINSFDIDFDIYLYDGVVTVQKNSFEAFTNNSDQNLFDIVYRGDPIFKFNLNDIVSEEVFNSFFDGISTSFDSENIQQVETLDIDTIFADLLMDFDKSFVNTEIRERVRIGKVLNTAKSNLVKNLRSTPIFVDQGPYTPTFTDSVFRTEDLVCEKSEVNVSDLIFKVGVNFVRDLSELESDQANLSDILEQIHQFLALQNDLSRSQFKLETAVCLKDKELRGLELNVSFDLEKNPKLKSSIGVFTSLANPNIVIPATSIDITQDILQLF